MYIVFEWLDWSWKDTQLLNSLNYLINKNKYIHIARLREPSNITVASNILKEKLINWFVSPEEAFNLYMEDKEELKHIRDNLLKNKTVILQSRSYLSTYWYQCAMWLDFDYANTNIHNLYINWKLDIPDVIFYFDITAKEAVTRIHKRWEKVEYFESEEFLDKAYNNYYKAFTNNCLWCKNIIKINASKSIEEVWLDVKTHLDLLFK